MPIPPPVDPRLLAAEIEASVAEFNRLAALATSLHITVLAEIQLQPSPDGPTRPVLAVQVVAPL
ncbi:hypothetical protein [Phenylobacterium sp. RIFCSPHIGHO2_01_FULL_69_31]|uniref:hypothetical protein n=1 Tax=Phenylobacterium sp. RIFCSPHIGHO2_01_FULL_69_31 TaxID=1801944 RepID=UPI0025E08CE4|nr:hypothetical protein [Phenylobacterium sp. RIFCSPHIGHO2_01_FULL_69_31]